jgi:hypothetical protein
MSLALKAYGSFFFFTRNRAFFDHQGKRKKNCPSKRFPARGRRAEAAVQCKLMPLTTLGSFHHHACLATAAAGAVAVAGPRPACTLYSRCTVRPVWLAVCVGPRILKTARPPTAIQLTRRRGGHQSVTELALACGPKTCGDPHQIGDAGSHRQIVARDPGPGPRPLQQQPAARGCLIGTTRQGIPPSRK